MDTLVDPITATTLDYTWDDASQLTEVAYGTSGAVRTFTYDNRGRLTTDTLEDDTPTTVFEVEYGYDTDSNLTSKDITVSGNNDAGLHSYEYDYADRLISWTDPGSTATDYEWDLAGNRVDAGSDTYTYDQRNRLTTGPEGDYTYTARGTLDTIDTTRTYDYDPFGRLTSAEGVSYSYDSLDRLATRGTDDFEYSDTGYDPVTDANQTFTRTPGGHLLSITNGTTDLLAGVDRHGDLTHLYQADGTITDTQSYDPYGDPTDTTGSFGPSLGFQSDWTDPTTTHVWQGARWYQPAWATFLSRDTLRGELATPVTLNRYTYANNIPLRYWDPYGLQPIDLTYGGQNCEINYACAPTPTKPATPTTSSAESADTVLINTARSTPDIYGVNSYYGSAQWQAYLKATTGWSSTSSSWWSTAWSNAWDFTNGLGRATGETLVSSTKSSLQAMFAPGLLVRDTIDSLSASYNKYGGGWKGGYIAANEVLNPAYSLIQSGRATINSAQAGDWQAAGYNTANTIKAAAETAVVVYTAGQTVSTVRARLASGGPGSPPADFVAGPPGSEPPVPVSQSRMAAGFSEAGFPATPTRAPGVEYTLPDLTKVRLMEASGEAPMRASFTNANGQPINPFTGKPVQPPAPAGLTMQEWVRAVTHVVQKK